MTSEASGSPAWDWWPSAHWGTGRWRGAGRLRPGLEGTRPHSPESSAGVRSTCRSPAILMPPFCSTTSRGLDRSSADCTPCLPAHPAWTRVCPPAAAAIRSTRPMLGPQGFLLHKEWTATPMLRARGTRQARDWLFSPQRMGSLAHRAASDFVHPKRPLRVRAVSVCVETSECGLSEKHAFWHKTRDITHFILFEALLSP